MTTMYYLNVIYKYGDISEILTLHGNVSIARTALKEALMRTYEEGVEFGEFPDVGSPIFCGDEYCYRLEETAISGCLIPLEVNE